MTRLRRRAKPARPYICLLSILKVNVAFDGAGAVGHGEPGGHGSPVLAESFGKAVQLAHTTAFGLDGPGFQALTVAVAEHVGELADQVAGGGEFLAAEW